MTEQIFSFCGGDIKHFYILSCFIVTSNFFLETFFFPPFFHHSKIVLQDFVGWIRSLFFSTNDLRRWMDRWISKELAAPGANALLHLAGMAVPWRWSVGLRTHLAQGDRSGRMTESTDGTTRQVFWREKKGAVFGKKFEDHGFRVISWISFSWEDFQVAPLREKKYNRWDVFRQRVGPGRGYFDRKWWALLSWGALLFGGHYVPRNLQA